MARFYQQARNFNFFISAAGDRSYDETVVAFKSSGTEEDNTYVPGEVMVKTTTGYVKFTGEETGTFHINGKREIVTADDVYRLVFISRDAEVQASKLVFTDGLTPTEIATAKAALADQGVVLR
ncbi:hypothetical protein ELI15_14145 [Rhizobium ruizarguesonis]|uniref:head decoration protein n=1 Tax=Rhizobium ruizarguesonis TaxID=2081791 RepID=UPI001031FE64|nr:head decoration protein [Rhizobium ruizarguesonis]TAW65431.1 hypothetical protein ELI15_14145 [Rhizobium ruizarguesonis]